MKKTFTKNGRFD